MTKKEGPPDPAPLVRITPQGVGYDAAGRRTFVEGNTVGPRFEPGNAAAVQHGARSPRMIAEREPEVLAEVERVCEGTPAAGASFALARAALARRIAQHSLLADYLASLGPLDEEGTVRAAAAFEMKVLGGIERALDSLGLTPTSAARLGVDLTRGASMVERMQADARARDAAREVDGEVAE